MRFLVTTVIVAGLILLALTLLANALKRQTLFFPARYPDGEWNRALFDPPPREVLIRSGDVKLHGWLFETAIPDAPLLIWHHGNGGNLTYRADPASELARRGISVLLYDYRGYGRSEGRPSETALYRDALAVHDFVTTERISSPERIFSYGESLGGPYAAYVASERPVAGVILENSFYSAGDVGTRVYRVPIGVLLGNSLPTARYLKKARVPVLVMHGRNDRVIPFGSAKRLYDELPVNKEFWISERADHNELPLEPEYYSRVTGFVSRISNEARSGIVKTHPSTRTSEEIR